MPKTYIYICILSLVFIATIFYLIYYNRVTEITPQEARDNIKQGKYDYIVDVRTKKEWDESHLENTISIPIGEFVAELPERIPDKNANILFVCKKGIRASGVVTIANKLGYNNVQALIGNYKEIMN